MIQRIRLVIFPFIIGVLAFLFLLYGLHTETASAGAGPDLPHPLSPRLDAASAEIIYAPEAAVLTLTKDGAAVGNTVYYTITLTNTGDEDGACAITDTFPSEVTPTGCTVQYYDATAVTTTLATFDGATLAASGLINCVDPGTLSARDPFSNTTGQGIDGDFNAAGSVRCNLDFSSIDGLISHIDVRVDWTSNSPSWLREFGFGVDTPPIDGTGAFCGPGCPSNRYQPGNGSVSINAHPILARDLTTGPPGAPGQGDGMWEFYFWDNYQDSGVTPDAYLRRFRFVVYGWSLTTNNIPAGDLTPSNDACNTAPFGKPAMNGIRVVYNCTGSISSCDQEFTNTASATGATSDSVSLCQPTAVTLDYFDAENTPNGVRLVWATGLEIDTLGFNLYRGNTPNGEYARINPELIRAKYIGMLQGGSYYWLDADAQPGKTYYFMLEEVDTHGHNTRYGPAVVTPPEIVVPYQVYLPVVQQ